MITADGNAIANTYRTAIAQAAIFTNTSAAATAGNNATFENPNPLNYREDMGRFDYAINDKHRSVRPLGRRLQHHLSGQRTGRRSCRSCRRIGTGPARAS